MNFNLQRITAILGSLSRPRITAVIAGVIAVACSFTSAPVAAQTDPSFGDAPSLAPRRAARLAAAIETPTPSLKPSLPQLAFVEPLDRPARSASATAPSRTSRPLPKTRREIIPRLKPSADAAAQKVALPIAGPQQTAVKTARPRIIPARALQGRDETNDSLEPHSPFFIADAERRPQKATLAIALAADLPRTPTEQTLRIERGEALVDMLRRAGVRGEDRNAAASALGKKVSLRRLRAGQEFRLVLTEDYQTIFQALSAPAQSRAEKHLLALDMNVDAEKRIRLVRTNSTEASNTVFEIDERTPRPTERLVSIRGRIDGSLYVSAKTLGAPANAIADLANMFAYDIDFQRDIFKGDAFEAVFNAQYDASGALIGAGDMVFGRLTWRGGARSKDYYRFMAASSGKRADYFDTDGRSAKRLLMKTPIDGARLSSGFGTRRHPVLGYRKAHKGVDFAARRGTPIYAAGDGTIERMNRFGSFGNYVRIRHAQGYKTAYAHLQGFKRGLRKGSRVEQGDVIGYVGTTGRSTGPHLHYEVHHNGKHVNPQRLKMATGIKLTGAEKTRFFAARDAIDALRQKDDDAGETKIVRSH
ncbi:MAG: peptidoglycan DD-metalloendopeptidase family protein [Pseudomonadota bacterium]